MSNSVAAMMILTMFAVVAASYSFAGQEPLAPVPTGDPAQLVDGNTTFALELYDQLRTTDGNLFFSPLSISTALAMTYGGARGNTAAEMALVLHFRLDPARLHPAFAALLKTLEAPQAENGYQLHTANALWVHQDYRFLPEFLALGQEHYDAGLEALDFSGAVEQARQRINTWAEQHTAGKIKDLIPPGMLGVTTKLVLTNAIYFKGNWAAQFEEKSTRDAPFTLADKTQVSVPTMHQTGEFGYLEQPNLQVLELPYAGDALSMVILLPREPDGLPALEQSLNPQRLAGWIGELKRRKVRVALPRFTLTCPFRLDQTLQALGMRDAFNPSRADLSGMDGTRELYIGAVLHKAFVEVNEEGTEAAAATAVVIKIRATPERPPLFQADRPFLFLIRDTRSGSLLFVGRLINPRP